MARDILIHSESCIACGRCVTVCPTFLFAQENPEAKATVSNVDHCIECGHCVAACPTHAIAHSYFPEGRVHAIDKSMLPSPEQMMLLCKARRSNRGFSEKPVPQEMLRQIVEAAHRAPTATNSRSVSFTVVTNPDLLIEVCRYTINYMKQMSRLIGNPILGPFIRMAIPLANRYKEAFDDNINAFNHGNKMLVLRNCTALLLIHTPPDSRFGRDDANLAYQNGSLMAESLGLSQIYAGYVMTAIRADKKNKLAKQLGINGTIHAAMMLGRKRIDFPNYIDREDVKVDFLE